MALVLPDERLIYPELLHPGRKPTFPVKVDWSHPLARGLVRFWLFTSRRSLTGERLANHPYGALEFATHNGEIALVLGPHATVYESVNTPVTGSENRTLLCEVFHNTSDVGYIFTINGAGGGNGNTGERWSIRHDNATGIRVEIQGSGYTSSLTANSGRHFVGCRLKGTTLGDHTLFVDGNQENTSGAGAVNTNSSYRVRIGQLSNSGTSSSSNEVTYWTALWNKALTDEQIESIRLNPYQFLIPR